MLNSLLVLTYIFSKVNNNFTASTDTNILSGGNYVVSATAVLVNDTMAESASTAETASVPDPLSTFDNPTETEGTTITSIMLRVPTAEPYPGHENLDPAKFTPSSTDRESGSVISPPSAWKNYTLSTDPFAHNAPPASQ